jgi:hypothetical protein
MTACHPTRRGGHSIFEPIPPGASEYGARAGEPVSGSAVPGHTPRSAPDIRWARGEMPRPHVEN